MDLQKLRLHFLKSWPRSVLAKFCHWKSIDFFCPSGDARRAELLLKALGFYGTCAHCKLQSFLLFLSSPSQVNESIRNCSWQKALGFCVLRKSRWQGTWSVEDQESRKRGKTSVFAAYRDSRSSRIYRCRRKSRNCLKTFIKGHIHY